MSKPILCVDFDGVIHAYVSPWTDAVTISDGPVPGALRWLYAATEHFNVQIYSSRSKDAAAREAMLGWMIRHSVGEFGRHHPMANRSNQVDYPIGFAHEKPAAFLTIDDRAITFDGNWDGLDPERLLKFKPWNKRSYCFAGLDPAMPLDLKQIAERIAAAAPRLVVRNHWTDYNRSLAISCGETMWTVYQAPRQIGDQTQQEIRGDLHAIVTQLRKIETERFRGQPVNAP